MKYKYLKKEGEILKLFANENEKPIIENALTAWIHSSEFINWELKCIEIPFATGEDAFDIIKDIDLIGENEYIDVTDITDIKYSNYLDAEKTKPNHLAYYIQVKDLNTTEYYQPLFDLMSEHNLTLLEGEMDEIISTVIEMENKKKYK